MKMITKGDRMRTRTLFLLSLICYATVFDQSPAQAGRWTEQQANDWYKKQAWLVGCNYNPANAINELEMWQAETFDPVRIDKELGWAESLGMNTLRVFLHDLLWQQDLEGFKKRLDQFLRICAKHKIKPIFVLFDSVWDPNPQLGKQRAPKPGVHNSGWMQSPGAKALQDAAQYPRLEAYVKGVIGAFAKDNRVLAWDILWVPKMPSESFRPEFHQIDGFNFDSAFVNSDNSASHSLGQTNLRKIRPLFRDGPFGLFRRINLIATSRFLRLDLPSISIREHT
jgi:hypothetical protein